MEKVEAGELARALSEAAEAANSLLVKVPLFEDNVNEEGGTFWFRDRNGKRWEVVLKELDE